MNQSAVCDALGQDRYFQLSNLRFEKPYQRHSFQRGRTSFLGTRAEQASQYTTL